MSAYINSVTLLGNLCSEVELRYASGNNEPVATFRIAVGSDKDVCYIPIVVFGKQAVNCERYLSKGSSCAVEGRLSMSMWQDKQTGKNRISYSVIAGRITFVGGAREQRQEQPAQSSSPAPSRGGVAHKYGRSDIPESMLPPETPPPQPDVPPSAGGHVPPPEGGYDDIPF